MYLINRVIFIGIALWFLALHINAQALLEANGPGNTYELINSVFAPNGGDVVENPECVHPAFGRHITEVWDASLNKYVFAFHIHVTPDNDRCINFDRQRMEIKTYEASPANLKGTPGETVVYKWKFKLPTGFQPSSSFTHLHQVKAVGGDDDDPIFTLTARKGSPNKLELNYYQSSVLNSQKLAQVNLSLFENTWVEVTERIFLSKTAGKYQIEIKNLQTSAIILSYSSSDIVTYRSDNSFVRPKWGIYRSLNSPSDLRDEVLYFNSFSVTEELQTSNNVGSKSTDIVRCVMDGKVLQLFCIGNQQLGSFKVYNMNGQIVCHLKNPIILTNQKMVFNLAHLGKGFYLLEYSVDNTTKVLRFVIDN